ncbi:hypothetical protein CDD82_6265 [Ophiocordyceps australis]|uniref:Uncharacterized protein n=1 Tax=Ophiocordyceps australis TaxID=1399860 RepID=A0A2C5ZRB5_9HYPO|nr:hypothetical protein CDD82_6265 [Ophiocordyceps australis]
MKAHAVIAVVGLASASPMGNSNSLSNSLSTRADNPSKSTDVDLNAWNSEYWKAKDAKLADALSKDDYDWTAAYTMDPVVEDIDCDKQNFDDATSSFPDCQNKCKDHFQNKVAVLGEIPLQSHDLVGVWGFQFDFQNKCLSERKCWLKKDWDRKEDVLVFKVGGKKAAFTSAGQPIGDVEITPSGYSVKGQSPIDCN